MKSSDTIKWEELMADVGKELRRGLIAVKRGTMVVRRYIGDSSEEANRHYRLTALKVKVHNDLSALGARVYSLVSSRRKANPARDAQVMDITAHIKRYAAEITTLEEKERRTGKRRIKASIDFPP